MISIEFGMGDLAQVRCTTDAVWETAASLRVLARPGHHPLHSRLQDRIPAHPRFDLALLLDLFASPQWMPDLLGPQPTAKPPSPLEQFDRLRATDPAVVASDLEQYRRLNPGGRIARMSVDELFERTTSTLTEYWRQVLSPLWERVEAIAGADIARLATAIAGEGLGRAIGRAHDELSYADGALRVDMHNTELSVHGTGQGVWLVPSVFRWPWVAVDPVGQAPVISYAARGAGLVWETDDSDSGSRLAALLGRSRAAVLQHLDIPRSTTGLADHLRLSPAAVSDHLSILTASGLLTARRDGRRVLYQRTGLAAALLAEVCSLDRDPATAAPS
ncbi:ArsR family transcriptional regulator [Kribbella sp. NPDC049227]|uniref:ArsR/SmtB family transcription factor n=1 Tax=Kribbella sp. NPDC049227 TaxID=3364113 RepID=UPI003723BE4C